MIRAERRRIPIVTQRAILIALYEALRQHQRGELGDKSIGVGVLPTDLSAVYLQVEEALQKHGRKGDRR